MHVTCPSLLIGAQAPHLARLANLKGGVDLCRFTVAAPRELPVTRVCLHSLLGQKKLFILIMGQ